MWWNKHLKEWVSICIEDPLKTWKKAKMYFKKPKCKIHFFSNPVFNCPYMDLQRIAKILDISSSDVGWKEKYNSSRHEYNPYIWICLFRKFGFSIHWNVSYYDEFGNTTDGNSYYWEYLLDYLYFRRSLKDCPTWTTRSNLYKEASWDSKDAMKLDYLDCVVPVVAMSLNKRGIEKLKSLVSKL